MVQCRRSKIKLGCVCPSHPKHFLKGPHRIFSSFPLKLFFKFLLILMLIVNTPPAWSADLKIEAGPDWIKGRADGVPLGQVLTQVAEKTGYAVYVDEDLMDLPISFDILDQMSSEDALRRMIHPHSYAMVYNKRSDENIFDILEVRVYTKGRQTSARYTSLAPGSTPGAGSSEETSGYQDPAASANGQGPGLAGAPSGPSLDPRTFVSQPTVAEEGAFGQGVTGSRDPAKGPDYRLSPDERHQAYIEFQQDKKAYERRVAAAQGSQFRAQQSQDQEDYKKQRNLALKKFLEQQTQ